MTDRAAYHTNFDNWIIYDPQDPTICWLITLKDRNGSIYWAHYFLPIDSPRKSPSIIGTGVEELTQSELEVMVARHSGRPQGFRAIEPNASPFTYSTRPCAECDEPFLSAENHYLCAGCRGE